MNSLIWVGSQRLTIEKTASLTCCSCYFREIPFRHLDHLDPSRIRSTSRNRRQSQRSVPLLCPLCVRHRRRRLCQHAPRDPGIIFQVSGIKCVHLAIKHGLKSLKSSNSWKYRQLALLKSCDSAFVLGLKLIPSLLPVSRIKVASSASGAAPSVDTITAATETSAPTPYIHVFSGVLISIRKST